MKKYIVVVLLFFSQFALFGGNPCEIYFDSEVPTANSIEINVKVKDFRDVWGFQMFMKWDSTVMRFNSLSYTNEVFGNALSYNENLSANVLGVGWSGVEVKSLDDDAVLFTVKYDFYGDPCDETILALFDQDPDRLSLVTWEDDPANDPLENPIRFTPITVTIPGTDCGSGGGNNCDDFHGFKLYVENVLSKAGDEVCVKIKVDSFVNIGALQFSIGWDKDFMAWVKESNNWASSQGASAIKIIKGDSLYLYVMDSTDPLNLADGSTLVELCFNVNANAQNGDFSALEVVDSLEFEVTNSSSVVLGHCTTDGKVTVGDVSTAVTLIASNTIVDKNQNTCVDITARNFKEIETFQFLTSWDSTVLKYTHIGPVNNIGINDGNINKVDGGKIKLSWNTPVGKTIADDGVLFQLCYDVVGDCNSSTPYHIFGDNSVAIEITSDDVILPHTEIDGSVKVECAIQYTVKVDDVVCNGESNGKIFISMACPTCNYTYKWSDSATETGPSRNGVKAGSYTVTITDTGSGNFVTETIVVNQPDPMTASGVVVNESCRINGSIDLTTIGGTSPYSYTWSNGISIEDIDGLVAGDYTVTITDSKNCKPSLEKTFTVGLDISPLVVTKGEFGDITCKGEADGFASVSVSGGCSSYTYLWNDGDTNSSRTGLGAGTYSVKVTDSKGQVSDEITFVFTDPEEVLVVGGDVFDGTIGSIELSITGGVEPYTYSWTGPDGFTSTDGDLAGLAPGTYVLTVTDARGCVKEGSFVVRGIIDKISIDRIVLGDYNGFGVKCNGDCNGTLDASVTANVPWKILLDNDTISLPYNSLCAGDHTLKVVDREGKEVEKTFTVSEPDAIEIEVDEINCSNDGKDDGSINIKVTGGAGDYVYDWGSGSGDDDSEITDLPKGKYSVIVTDENNCKVVSEDIVVDNCDKSECYKGSAVITPNGDEYNEFFLVKCASDFVSSTLNVYDRLGNLKYTQANYNGTWNGLDSDGNELIEDSYMWVFIGQKANGETSVYKGTVSILR